MAQPLPTPHPTDQLLGASPAIAALRAQLRHLASFDTLGGAAVPTVLLQGETGTGKGLVARLLHDSGPRARGPFVEVSCAAIPEALVEAELFGFVAGAFTDAKRPKPGLFAVASGGTLFLDELDALPLALQGKLLTAIEAKRVRRVGAVTEHPVDIKLTVATAVDLGARVAAGQFRADLYYRLAVVPLTLPPLRARGDDIVRLAQHYLHRYAAAHGLPPKRVDQAAEAWLLRYAWPGNVRELGHLMERVTLLHPEALVTPAVLTQLCLPPGSAAAHVEAVSATPSAPADEATRIQQALAQTGGNVAQAARQLGWSRKALRYRMHRHGVETPPRTRGRPPRQARPEAPPATSSGARQAFTPPGEQKPVVVLVIELTFPEAGPPAPAYEPWTAARRWEQALVEKVRGFGGTLVQRTPSLLLVAFGVPHTLEQLPQRAIQAALALRQVAAECAPWVRVRQVGHWGEVLVGGQARESPPPLLPLGETLALPVRLLGQAGPGDVVLSPALARLVVGWCALEPLPAPAGQVPPPPVSAYRVGGLVPRRSPLAGLGAQTLSPFMGRVRELAALEALLAAVEAGRGQAVGLVGEPGMGKSRLLWEFRRRLAGHGVTYLEGRCLAYGQASPYLPMLDLLRENCALTETDAPAQVAEKVRRALAEVGLDADAWAPYLLHLLDVPGALDPVAGLGPAVLRQRTIEALCQLSLDGSQRRPLILAVEDLQWVDPSSDACCTALVARLADAPILFLATYRPGYRPPWLGQSYATQLVLPPLASPESRHVVQMVWQATPPPEALTQAILARAEGNPLFLEELTRAVREQGGTPAATAVPDTLQGVLRARIDRLPAAARRALQLAAVVGRECPLPLLEALWEGEAVALPPALARLVAAELLYQHGGPPQVMYRFKHVLIQEVAAQTLPSSQRPPTHRRIAQVMAEGFPEMAAAHPERLAQHYHEAGLLGDAVDAWRRAGEQALVHSATREAITYLTHGLEALATLPETAERLGQELTLQLTLGAALTASQGYAAPAVERAYARAHAVCQQVGETPPLFPALWGLYAFELVRGRLPRALALATQLLELAERRHEAALPLIAHRELGVTLFYCGELVGARAHLEQALALDNPAPHPGPAVLYGSDSRPHCLVYLARVLGLLGYADQALARLHEALALAQARAHPFSLALTHYVAAAFHRDCGEAAATHQQAEAAIAVATVQGFPHWVARATVLRGWALTRQEQATAGLAQMREGLAACEAGGAALSRPLFLALLGEAYGHVGQVDEGLTLLAEALAAVRDTGEQWQAAEVYRLTGALLLKQAAGSSAEAETWFQQALAVARDQQAKAWELRATMSLCRLWQHQGKREATRQLLTEVYGWFTEGFNTADLLEAKALLENL